MKTLLASIFLIFSLWVTAATYTPAQVPDVHRHDRTQFVANPDGILSAQAVEQLNEMMAQMRMQLTVEPMVVAVDDITDPDDYQEFATELFERWGLGKSDLDNGLLVLMVKNRREVVIRPGYGLEGVLPDITCGRILREVFFPAARDGDYDGAMLGTMGIIDNILSDPVAAEEYRSKEADADAQGSAEDDLDAFMLYLGCAVALALIMLALFLMRLSSLKGKSDYEKYKAMSSWQSIYLALTAAGLFIPLIATVPLILRLNRWRNKPRTCPHCSTKMYKVDEVHDNDYLTPSQDLEERIGSVDYDVWLCPKCGETDILAYTLPSSTYTECDKCHARTMRPLGYRVVRRPTQNQNGLAVKEYECLNCHNHRQDNIDLPPDDAGRNAAAAAAVGAILGGMGRGGSSGSFGPIGGGFGGGHTGGGGAGGRW